MELGWVLDTAGAGTKLQQGARWVAEGGTGRAGNIRRQEGSWYSHLTGFLPVTGQDTAPPLGGNSE